MIDIHRRAMRFTFPFAIVIGCMTMASPALAHPGHGRRGGFVAGLLHPLTGMDHFLAMVMVGLWAGFAFPRNRWAFPAIFVSFMLAGFLWGANANNFPFSDLLIIASLAGLGLALIFEVRLPLALATMVVALFAVGHGFAHGAEMPAASNAISFVGGFTVTTIMLHLVGLGISQSRFDTRLFRRVIGAAATAMAVSMVISQ